MDKSRAIWKSEINPPTKKEKRDRHQRDNHGVFHQCVGVVFAPGRGDFIQTKADVNKKHKHDGNPVIKLGEDYPECCKLVIHLNLLKYVCTFQYE